MAALTQRLHAWGLAQDGPEPGGGAGARRGGVVAWGGGVGLEAGSGGFVVLLTEERERDSHSRKRGAAQTDNLRAN